MGLARASVGFEHRNAQGGDLIQTGELIATDTTATSTTLLAAALAAGILRRTGPSAGFTDTFPSAQSLLDALGGGDGVVPGVSFRFTYINGVAQAMTAAAGEGCVLGTNVNVAASAIRTYLVTFNNTTQRQQFVATTTSGQATVPLSVDQAKLLSVGMSVSGTGITAGSVINSINYGTGVVTLSANASGSGTNAITFSPTYTIAGLFAGTA